MRQQQDYSWLRDVRDVLAAGELMEPPDWVRERARRLYVTHGPRLAPSLVERVRASLIFDSRRRGLAPAGVRALAVADGTWQLLFRSGEIDIDLLVRPNQDGRTLSVRGQALPLTGGSIGMGVVEATPADAPRRLRQTPVPSVRSALEPSGEFALRDLERGRYDVLLRFGAREIELSDLEL